MQSEAHRRGSSLTDAIIRDVQRMVYCLRMYQRPLGARGVAAYCSYRLFGSPRSLTIKPVGTPSSVTLRMRTGDISIYEEVLLRGQYALPVTFMPKTIVDLGANIGMASVYYANQYPEAKIVAAEAEASNFAALCQNVRSYRNILPVHAAVWSGDGLVTMTTPEGTDAGIDTLTFAVREGDGTQVRSVTMTTLMRETGISSIDLLKVDIEGAEKEVFEAASDWVHGIRCIAIELHDRFKPGCTSALRSVTGDFLESQRGETTFYIRKSSCLSPPQEQLPS